MITDRVSVRKICVLYAGTPWLCAWRRKLSLIVIQQLQMSRMEDVLRSCWLFILSKQRCMFYLFDICCMFYLFKVNVVQFLDYCLDDGRVRISILHCAKTSRRVLSNSYRTFFAHGHCDRNMQLTTYMHLLVAATLGIRLAIPPLFHTSFWQGS